MLVLERFFSLLVLHIPSHSVEMVDIEDYRRPVEIKHGHEFLKRGFDRFLANVKVKINLWLLIWFLNCNWFDVVVVLFFIWSAVHLAERYIRRSCQITFFFVVTLLQPNSLCDRVWVIHNEFSGLRNSNFLVLMYKSELFDHSLVYSNFLNTELHWIIVRALLECIDDFHATFRNKEDSGVL